MIYWIISICLIVVIFVMYGDAKKIQKQRDCEAEKKSKTRQSKIIICIHCNSMMRYPEEMITLNETHRIVCHKCFKTTEYTCVKENSGETLEMYHKEEL